MITLLPGKHRPYSIATFKTKFIKASLDTGILYPMTPLDRLHYLTVQLDVEQARIGWNGLYLAINLAILPVWVRQTNMSTLLFLGCQVTFRVLLYKNISPKIFKFDRYGYFQHISEIMEIRDFSYFLEIILRFLLIVDLSMHFKL